MSVVDRQARRAASPAAPAQNPFVRYDPVADIPNEQGLLEQPQPVIPGGGPANQMVDDPYPPVESPADPEINDVRLALALYDRMKTQGPEGMGEANYRKGERMLRSFADRHPGALREARDANTRQVWFDENLDRSPARNSRLYAAQRDASRSKQILRTGGRDPGGVFNDPNLIPFPNSEKDLPPLEPGTRAEVLDREEKSGLDTMTGVTNIVEELNFARKVNGSHAQFQLMYGMIKDRLDAAGVELPPGVHPVSLNEDLGQLEALVPTAEGKVRRVLVDSEFIRLADIGGVADIEELMSMTGAVLSQITPGSLGKTVSTRLAQRHPALAELVGDFGWRNTGVLIEGLLDAEALGGDTGIADLAEAMQGNASESFWGTVAGRVTGRLFGSNPNKGEIMADINQYTKGIKYPPGATWMERFKIRNDVLNQAARDAEKSIDDTLAESAETLEQLQGLSDGPFYVDRGAVSGSADEIATQGGREARLSSREQRAIDVKRQRNKETLNEAVENIHENRMPTNPARNPQTTQDRINAARADEVSKLDEIDHNYSQTDYGDGHYEQLHHFRFKRGSGDTKGFEGEQPSGAVARVNTRDKTVRLEWIGADSELKYSGTTLLDALQEFMASGAVPSGYRILSGDQMSRYSVQMVQRMAREEGFQVQMLPYKKTTDQEGRVWYTGNRGQGVFEVTELPGYTVHTPVVGDLAGYSKGRMAEVLDADLEYAADVTAQANFWGLKQDAQIGWQPDRQKSLYSVVNPKSSKLNRYATQLQQRVQRSLTGEDVSKADGMLGRVFVKTVDEEGDTVLAGLTSPELDLGHLLRSRDTLAGIAERTGDKEVADLVTHIDELLYNGKVVDARGIPIDEATSVSLRATMGHTREATTLMREVESSINSNALFKQNELGEYVNTDLKTLETALANGSKFWLHLKPWMQGNANAHSMMQEALGSIYTKNVLDKGWTMARHRAFFDRFGHAADQVFGVDEAARLRNTRFSNSGANPFKEAADAARSKADRLNRYGQVRAGNLVNDFSDMADRAIDSAGAAVTERGKRMTAQEVSIGSSRVRKYLDELNDLNPELADQLRADSLRETKLHIQENFLTNNINKDPTQQIKGFGTWINENEATLAALHGEQYVTDLRTVQHALHLDGQRFTMSGAVPELQGDIVRVSRTLMGPLSVFQRRVSAANWVRLRWSAGKALDLLSDPAAIRQLNAYKGYSMRSRPVIAFLARTGFLPGTSWDGKGEMPTEVYAKGLEFADWLDQMDEELKASEKVESKE